MSGWVPFFALPVALAVGYGIYAVRKTRVATVTAITFVALALLFGVANGCGYKQALNNSIEERTFTVNSKERSGGDSDGKWLVFTDDGVFSVQDSLWLWKFDASDRYNEVRVGGTYTCRVAGWRIHFTSDYENLIACEDSDV